MEVHQLMTSLTFISDSHCRHSEIPTDQLPGGDFLIHTGDFSNSGTVTQCNEFFEWFSAQTQYTHRIFIAGNHDRLAESDSSLFRRLVPANCHYLEDSGIELEGLKFWGTPVTAMFCNWAFNRSYTELHKHFNYIPDDVNIVLTHGGPYGLLQNLENGLDIGMEPLNEKLIDLPNLLVSAFGHVHHSYGQLNLGKTHFVNSAICGENYQVTNKPITILL
jgi:Icc-related predicted phosphoesterase